MSLGATATAPRRRMVVAIATSLLLSLGCGGGTRAVTPPRGSTTHGASSTPPTRVSTETYATLDTLAQRAPSATPLMHEVVRLERVAPRSADVRAERDLCMRALFAAPRAVRIWFADEGGSTRGEVASGLEGATPPRGPACVKKGEALHLVVEEAEGQPASAGGIEVRAVIFASP